MVFSGINPQAGLAEIIEIPSHPFFIASQFHPEFTSRPLKPNPLFREFVAASIRHQGH
jgi:CTP synthase